MNYRYLIFTLILIISAKYSFSQQDTVNPNGYNVFHYPNGFKLSEGNMVNGKPDGYWITYYVNGKRKSEGNRKNFIVDSLWTFYAENGDTTETIYYLQGKRNGLYTKYYTRLDSGVNSIKSKELYVNDQKQGFSFYYYPSGQLQNKIKYVDNYKHGDGYEYSPDGTLIAIDEYRYNNMVSRKAVNRTDNSGQKTGVWVEVFDNGKIKSEINFVSGIPNGTYKEFSPSGKIISVEKYQNGKMVSQVQQPKSTDTLEVKKVELVQDFYPDGKLKSSKTYRDSVPYGTHIFYNQQGKIINAQIFDEYGIKTAEGIIDTNSNKFGHWKYYFDDGLVKSEGELDNNSREGEWTFYYPNGNVRQKGKYEKNYPEGKWLWYYDNGNLLREENYFIGALSGLAYELSIEGDTIVKGKYSDGMPHGKWFFKIGDEYEIGELYYGAKTGEWLTYFYPEMKIKCKTEYIDGKKSGKHKCYYLNKKYREIGEYSNNNKTGKWTYYNPDGSIDFTAEYSRDEIIKVNDMPVK